MQKVSVGRIVHYVMPEGRAQGGHRAAVVVRVWDAEAGYVNLQVITDGTNDGPECASGLLWATSVLPDEETKAEGTWHWPERD